MNLNETKYKIQTPMTGPQKSIEAIFDILAYMNGVYAHFTDQLNKTTFGNGNVVYLYEVIFYQNAYEKQKKFYEITYNASRDEYTYNEVSV